MKKVFVVNGFFRQDGMPYTSLHETMHQAVKAFEADEKLDHKKPTHITEGWAKINA